MEKLYESNLVGRRGPPLPRCISRLFWLKNAFLLSDLTLLNSEEIKVVRYAHWCQKTYFVLKFQYYDLVNNRVGPYEGLGLGLGLLTMDE